ncbi:pseudouridine-5'-phosphate glycosidase [Paucibacter sp. O1-1]|nr:pseudouridine-5'-phosphate glycosidase [Paucibacter sp. O1-1]MDA3824360.1 pseudouridine-5'-phosphate glycosidase [Paucibacter sp. O1-1]
MSPTLNPLLDIHPEVRPEALAAGRPVVALESTISHGMPWPDNARTALAVQAEVRAHGAVLATIAVIDGRLKAGLDAAQIERLGQAGQATAKASRRDLPLLVAGVMAMCTGATTVAATMIIAALAGIRVFATGGIGGVHRGAETSLDISADLQELARTLGGRGVRRRQERLPGSWA